MQGAFVRVEVFFQVFYPQQGVLVGSLMVYLLFGQDTADLMGIADCIGCRHAAGAYLGGILAPGGESAARRQIGRVGHQAFYGAEPSYILGERWDGSQQALGVRVPWIFKNILQRAQLDHLPGIHDRHTIAILRHHTEVMGDEQHSGVQTALEGGYHVQHLRLDRHIQGCGGFIGDQERWIAGQGDGDDDPLLHPPGELMGIFMAAVRRDTNHLQHIASLLVHLPCLRSWYGLPRPP